MKIRVRNGVEVLDIGEYLALTFAERRQVDALLDRRGTRPISEAALHVLIQVFGPESVTGQALANLMAPGTGGFAEAGRDAESGDDNGAF